MDVEAFCRRSHVVVVLGKGGVGKTTITAALARLASDCGLDVLIVALDDSGHFPHLFGREGTLTEEMSILLEGSGESPAGGRVKGRIRARLVTADAALAEYLDSRGFGAVARRIVDAGTLEVIATAAPGVRELLVLGTIKQLERDGVADLIVLDAPATGHAVTLLSSPSGIADAARSGPLHDQSEQVVEFLRNDARCQVLLVTIPEETPVNEVVETAYLLEDTMYVALGPVVVNGRYPELSAIASDPAEAARRAGVETDPETLERVGQAARFRFGRQQLQAHQCERLRSELPLPQLQLPFVFSPEVDEHAITVLADAFRDAVTEL